MACVLKRLLSLPNNKQPCITDVLSIHDAVFLHDAATRLSIHLMANFTDSLHG